MSLWSEKVAAHSIHETLNALDSALTRNSKVPLGGEGYRNEQAWLDDTDRVQGWCGPQAVTPARRIRLRDWQRGSV